MIMFFFIECHSWLYSTQNICYKEYYVSIRVVVLCCGLMALELTHSCVIFYQIMNETPHF